MRISGRSPHPGSHWRSLLLLVAAIAPCQAFAQASAAEDSSTWPRLGGHVGLAVPIVKIATGGVTAIGADFIQIGIVPGVTIKLDEHWAMDLEGVGYTTWQFAEGATPARASTAFVVDPGVIYNFGSFATGLRLGTQIGEGVPFNGGLIPLVNFGLFPLGKFKWFAELDLPFFVLGEPGSSATVSFSPQIHTGVSF